MTICAARVRRGVRSRVADEGEFRMLAVAPHARRVRASARRWRGTVLDRFREEGAVAVVLSSTPGDGPPRTGSTSGSASPLPRAGLGSRYPASS